MPELDYGVQWEVMAEPIARPGAAADSRYLTNGWPYLVSASTKYPGDAEVIGDLDAEKRSRIVTRLRREAHMMMRCGRC